MDEWSRIFRIWLYVAVGAGFFTFLVVVLTTAAWIYSRSANQLMELGAPSAAGVVVAHSNVALAAAVWSLACSTPFMVALGVLQRRMQKAAREESRLLLKGGRTLAERLRASGEGGVRSFTDDKPEKPTLEQQQWTHTLTAIGTFGAFVVGALGLAFAVWVQLAK